MHEHYDAVIVGGGPAGTTCAVKLAQRGRKILILERAKFPRFHIGESITAFGFKVFKDLGVYEELKAINEVKKKGLEYVLPNKTRKVYFLRDEPNEPDERPWAFQMSRSTLDQVLLENARRKGVTVREECLAKRVLFEGSRAVGVEYKDFSTGGDGELRRAYGKWVIDASGQGALINHQLRDNWYSDPLLEKKMAVFSHWRGDIEVQNTDQDLNFKLCSHPNGREWAWYIPIAKDTLSLGVVLSQETVKRELAQSKTPSQIFYDYAKDIPYISDILRNPTLKTIEKFRCVKDYSYRSKKYYGDHWVTVGDSAGFIDPVFSTGLQVAFNSAYALIDPLDAIMDEEPAQLSRLKGYDAALDRYYRINSVLVYLFYLCKLNHELFYSPAYLWKTIQWAGWKYRLGVLWHGLRYRLASRDKRLRWAIQVLFGNPTKENVVGDLYMVISRNYDAVYRDRTEKEARQDFTKVIEADA